MKYIIIEIAEKSVAPLQIIQHHFSGWECPVVIPGMVVVHTRLGEDRCTLKDVDSGYQASVCDGLGHRKRTRDILLWLMTGDTCKICGLWRSCSCWSGTRKGKVVGWSLLKAAGMKMVVIHLCLIAPAAWSLHGRPLIVTLCSVAGSQPVTAAMC